MGLLKKATILLAAYSIYQLVTDKKYADLRELVNKRYNQIKPMINDFLNNVDLYLTFAKSVDQEKTHLELETKIENLKKEIQNIDVVKIADASSSTIISIGSKLNELRADLSNKILSNDKKMTAKSKK